MKRVVVVLLALFLLVGAVLMLGGLFWVRREASAPVVTAEAGLATGEGGGARAVVGHGARPSVEGSVEEAPPAVVFPEDLDEPATHKAPKAAAAADPILEPDAFRQKLVAAGDPLLPEVEQLLAARGLAGTPAVSGAAWMVARNWGIYLRAEETTKVEDAAAREDLAASRRRILIDAPREALTRALGGTVEASLWTDLEALGRKHQPAAAPQRAPRQLRPLPLEGSDGK